MTAIFEGIEIHIKKETSCWDILGIHSPTFRESQYVVLHRSKFLRMKADFWGRKVFILKRLLSIYLGGQMTTPTRLTAFLHQIELSPMASRIETVERSTFSKEKICVEDSSQAEYNIRDLAKKKTTLLETSPKMEAFIFVNSIIVAWACKP